MNRSVHWRTRTAAAVAPALSLGVLAACSSSSSSGGGAAASSSAPGASGAASSAPSSSGGAAATSPSACGSKPGVAATGTPINIGASDTKQNGTDFSDIQNMTGAYFACVN